MSAPQLTPEQIEAAAHQLRMHGDAQDRWLAEEALNRDTAASDDYLEMTTCKACESAAVAVQPHLVPLARCGPCIASGAIVAGAPLARKVMPPRPGVNKPYERPAFELPPAEPYPAPHITSDMPWRPGAPDIPAPVSALAKLAGKHGWDSRITYSRGHFPHATHGHPTALRHNFLFRLTGFLTDEIVPMLAIASYSAAVRDGDLAWTWKDRIIADRQGRMLGGLSSADLRYFIKERGSVSSEWLTGVSERAFHKKEAANDAED